MICWAGILTSKVGTVREGTIVHKNDKRVGAVPEAFQPLIDSVERKGTRG